MISFRERRPWLVGITSIAIITAGVIFAFSINRFEGLRGVYSISVDLKDAAGLQSGNEVRVAGVKVGQVKGISLTDTAARIKLEIENDIDIPAETRVEVKLKTLLGQKFIDLQFPDAFLSAASGGGDPSDATAGFLEDGDVIPRSQTRVPFEIYQAATEGTAVLEEIDKAQLRRLLDVLSDTVGASKDELRRALVSLDEVGSVLSEKGEDITELLANTQKVTRTLAGSGGNIEGILARSSEVLGVLADRRATISSLLDATNELTGNLGVIIQVSRGSIDAGTADLNDVLGLVQGELDSIDAALAELGTSFELFGRPLKFGRFIEGHVCAITTEDTCVPGGTPEVPGLPVKGTQPPSSGGKVAQ